MNPMVLPTGDLTVTAYLLAIDRWHSLMMDIDDRMFLFAAKD